jgi:hypothetical protein
METEKQIEPERAATGTIAIEEAVIEKLRTLPPERKQQVLDFVEFLEQRSTVKRPRRSLKGIWAGLGYSVSEEDIAEARREMWGNFPREDI